MLRDSPRNKLPSFWILRSLSTLYTTSLSPYNRVTLFLSIDNVAAKFHSKSLALTKLAFKANSKPLFSIAPIFSIVLLKPVVVGNEWLINKSLFFIKKASTDKRTLFCKKAISTPKFHCFCFSQLISGVPRRPLETKEFV